MYSTAISRVKPTITIGSQLRRICNSCNLRTADERRSCGNFKVKHRASALVSSSRVTTPSSWLLSDTGTCICYSCAYSEELFATVCIQSWGFKGNTSGWRAFGCLYTELRGSESIPSVCQYGREESACSLGCGANIKIACADIGFTIRVVLTCLSCFLFRDSHHFWLRDHCRCPECFHQITKQRLVDTFEVRGTSWYTVGSASLTRKIDSSEHSAIEC